MRPRQASAANSAGMDWKSCVNCSARMVRIEREVNICEKPSKGVPGRSVYAANVRTGDRVCGRYAVLLLDSNGQIFWNITWRRQTKSDHDNLQDTETGCGFDLIKPHLLDRSAQLGRDSEHLDALHGAEHTRSCA
jgi:hypothetical protein